MAQISLNNNKKINVCLGLLGWIFLFSPALLEGISQYSVLLCLVSVFVFSAITLCRPILLGGLVFLLLMGFVNIVHFAFFGSLVDQLFLATALRTNKEETYELFNVLPWSWVALASLWLVVGVYGARKVWHLSALLAEKRWLRRIAQLVLLVWIVFMAQALFKGYSFESISRKIKTLYPMHIVRAWSAQQQLTENLFYAPVIPEGQLQASQVDTLVVVIGESASAERWSLLGYEGADTNGALAEIPGVTAIRVMAHGLNTAASLPYLLTGMSAEQSVQLQAASFLDIAR